MVNLLSQIFQDTSVFEEKIHTFITAIGIQEKLLQFQIDHLAIHVKTDEDGMDLMRSFSHIGKTVSDSDVNGRKVCVFHLLHSVLFLGQNVEFVELLFPKSDQCFESSNWDHVEFVIPRQAGNYTYEDTIMYRLGKEKIDFIKNNYTYNVSVPMINGRTNDANISVSIKNTDGSLIKLHPTALSHVLIMEKNF